MLSHMAVFHLFLWPEWCCTEHVDHIFSIQSSVTGHFGHLHILATVKEAAMNIGRMCLCQYMLLSFSGT